MRPRGEIRQAVAGAVDTLLQARPCVAGREVAAHAQVGFEASRRTLQNMQRAGELAVVGTAQLPGVCRPVNLYARPPSSADVSAAELRTVFRCWVGAR